jgi:curved DNA-binding protein CbpA
MASLAALRHRLDLIEEQSYYEILRVPSGAPMDDVKAAFHEFALDVHPDRFVDAPPEEGKVASEIFKRGVEAYKVLSNPKQRATYDEGLLDGSLRLVEGRKQQQPPPAAPREMTLEELAQRPKAKQFALRADRFLSAGRFDDARIALMNAINEDFDNEDLKDRLNDVYKSIAASGAIELEVDAPIRRR